MNEWDKECSSPKKLRVTANEHVPQEISMQNNEMLEDEDSQIEEEFVMAEDVERNVNE